LIESANGGDLFLDEIADMPPEVQAAVLRVLEERRITRVGGRESLSVNVRFLSATNADLEDERRGFRHDLLDRLRLGGTVWLPPLRDRPTDIPVLVERFVREAESQRQGTRRRQITDEAMLLLQGRDWPGNVRELRSAVFDAVTRHPDVEHLVPSHLRINERRVVQTGSDRTTDVPVAHSARGSLDDLLLRLAATEVDPTDVAGWSGKLEEVQREYARLTARMLRAALEATRRRTPASPEGELQIHPAVKLLTGDATLTASKAADLIKRLLAPIENELAGDLAEAHQIALRLRPRSNSRSPRAGSSS
jgi:DNA-binding NtrC family response regulator